MRSKCITLAYSNLELAANLSWHVYKIVFQEK